MKIEIDEGIKSILIVEDEGLLALMIEDLAREMGVREVYSCADLASAIEAARTAQVDCAVLDLRLRGESSTAVADILAERNIPFVFSTGSGTESIAERHRD